MDVRTGPSLSETKLVGREPEGRKVLWTQRLFIRSGRRRFGGVHEEENAKCEALNFKRERVEEEEKKH